MNLKRGKEERKKIPKINKLAKKSYSGKVYITYYAKKSLAVKTKMLRKKFGKLYVLSLKENKYLI